MHNNKYENSNYENSNYGNINYPIKKEKKPFVEKYRIVLVDEKTRRFIGMFNGQVKLLDEFDSDSKPFIMRVNINFLPRVGEFIKLPNYYKRMEVKGILHNFEISGSVPSSVYLFVDYTTRGKEKSEPQD